MKTYSKGNTTFYYASYSQLVDILIKERYSQSAENAILRQRDTKPQEFEEYNAYCEECKVRAKEIIGEQNENL